MSELVAEVGESLELLGACKLSLCCGALSLCCKREEEHGGTGERALSLCWEREECPAERESLAGRGKGGRRKRGLVGERTKRKEERE